MPETNPDPAALANRAELEKLTKAELVERVMGETAERYAAERRLQERVSEARRVRPEDGFVVAALVDLYRASTQAGLSGAGRYLDAALKLGAPLADAILGDAPTE